MKTQILVAVALLLCMPVARGTGFMDRYNVTSYTMNDGMANNHINDLYIDSKGFLWIAFNGGGISRFDGHEAYNLSDTGDELSIKDGFVRGIAEDRLNRLWIAGESGIDILDLKTMSIVYPADHTGAFYDMSNKLATDVMVDSAGDVWVSFPNEVARVEVNADGSIESIRFIDLPGSFHRGITVRDINGEIWVGAVNTVKRVVTKPSGDLMPADVSPKLTNLPNVSYISDIELKENEVWVSTNHGVYRYDPANDMVKLYLHTASEHSLTQNYTTDIAVTADKQLVVSTLQGLNIYNPISDDFERCNESRHTLNDQFVSRVVVNGNHIFVATESGGLNVLTPRRLKIKSLQNDVSDPSSLSNNPVNAIIETRDGTLWVGTVEGGLNVRRPGVSGFTHIRAGSGLISHNSVSALAADGNGNLWVGTWGGGVDVITTAEPYRRLRSFNHETVDSLDMTFIGSLIYDEKNNGMWIGSNVGLLFYDFAAGKLAPGVITTPEVIVFGFVGSLIDDDNRLWVGSNNGLLMVDLNDRDTDGRFRYRYFRNLRGDENSLVKPSSFCRGSDGSLWIGTNGQGMYRCTIIDGEYQFDNYNSNHGLRSNAVKSLAASPDGRIWAATINGLSCFDPERESFDNYTTGDGLPDNQFYWNAACNTTAGHLLFGTVNGIADIDPDSDDVDSMSQPVLFTRLYVDNRPVGIDDLDITERDIAYTDHITLHESNKSFEVEFSALDFAPGGDAAYSYQLVGFDDNPIKLNDGHRRATYTNLPPGKYTLRVMYHPNGQDSESGPVSELKVTVKPYFYKTVWFITLIIIMLAIGAYVYVRLREKDLKQQKNILKSEVDKSVAEIARQKKLAEEHAAELAERNQALTASNEEITRQKQQLTDMNRQIQEMTVDRISFFTNITHEFRTPITLIIGPIERALKLSTNPKVIEQLQFVERNSKNLLTLVNQLMDFRKIESGKMEISRTMGDFTRFLNDVVKPFRPVADERGIDIRVLMRLKYNRFAFDEESLRKVSVNLLANAIKFTPDGGTVTVYAAMMPCSSDAGGSTLYLGVSDTGSGIAEKDIAHVFDRFFQGDSNLKYPIAGAGDSGVGLYLCRSIVELYGGTIDVRNNHGSGCTFRVFLPIPGVDKSTADAGDDTKALVASRRSSVGDDNVESTDKTLLVVEDNQDMRRFICSLLRDKYTLLEASDGAEALNILLEKHVDLIISDLMMPVMDGNELSRCVKENFSISHIPFIMLTAKTSDNARIDSYRVGVDSYLLKPFEEEVLLARIEGILKSRQRLQSKFAVNMNTDELEITEESRDKRFADQVMEVVKQNYKNSYFEVGDFAEALGISRSLLNKKLQSLMGQSAGQLMRNYRLNIARQLITKNRVTRNMNISEIAYEVGFNDSKYFTRCFTKQFGSTPSSMMGSDR
ncbi:MAG: response regulator [Muribaculaceae bacterium]|nr:response regulator [Muribaculaceae bacterium]